MVELSAQREPSEVVLPGIRRVHGNTDHGRRCAEPSGWIASLPLRVGGRSRSGAGGRWEGGRVEREEGVIVHAGWLARGLWHHDAFSIEEGEKVCTRGMSDRSARWPLGGRSEGKQSGKR